MVFFSHKLILITEQLSGCSSPTIYIILHVCGKACHQLADSLWFPQVVHKSSGEKFLGNSTFEKNLAMN